MPKRHAPPDETAEPAPRPPEAPIRKPGEEPVQDGDMLADPALARINSGDEERDASPET